MALSDHQRRQATDQRGMNCTRCSTMQSFTPEADDEQAKNITA
jgi:hypothetical protein